MDRWTGHAVLALREAMRLSQKEFAARAQGVSQQSISAWERGKSKRISAVGEQAMDRLLAGCDPAARQRFHSVIPSSDESRPHIGHHEDVNRRSFLQAMGLSAVSPIVPDMAASLAGGDASVLATVQTSHVVDRAIAAEIDKSTVRRMLMWAQDDGSELVRVNAAGILAKIQAGPADAVVRVLTHDYDVSRRYMTAVVARVLGVDHGQAAGYVVSPETAPVQQLAQSLTAETINPNDVGARWSAATMLARLSPHLGRV
jgi:transcriptional regulator with XRE-family HTH domain